MFKRIKQLFEPREIKEERREIDRLKKVKSDYHEFIGSLCEEIIEQRFKELTESCGIFCEHLIYEEEYATEVAAHYIIQTEFLIAFPQHAKYWKDLEAYVGIIPTSKCGGDRQLEKMFKDRIAVLIETLTKGIEV